MLKKLTLTLAALIVAISASAEFRWGPTAGININTLSWQQDLVKTQQLVGFNAGLQGELMIPGIGFGIDMALKYDRHGAKVNFGEYKVWSSQGLGNENVWFNTIQVPINLKFKWTRMNGLEQYVAPFAFAGPVFGFTCSTTDLPAIQHPAGYVALQFGVGGEFFEHLQLSTGYSWGLSYEINTIQLDNFSARPNGWFVNLAWLFK